jgi:hypothetical protein
MSRPAYSLNISPLDGAALLWSKTGQEPTE